MFHKLQRIIVNFVVEGWTFGVFSHVSNVATGGYRYKSYFLSPVFMWSETY